VGARPWLQLRLARLAYSRPAWTTTLGSAAIGGAYCRQG